MYSICTAFYVSRFAVWKKICPFTKIFWLPFLRKAVVQHVSLWLTWSLSYISYHRSESSVITMVCAYCYFITFLSREMWFLPLGIEFDIYFEKRKGEMVVINKIFYFWIHLKLRAIFERGHPLISRKSERFPIYNFFVL